MRAVAELEDDEQFVTLAIDQEVFAVPVEAVLEILDMRPMFRIPDAPAYLAGLIDVRGRSVPVVNLRLRLGLPVVAPTEHTRILVLEAPIDGRSITLGLIADRVFEVTSLDRGAIEAPPDIGMKWRSEHIRGVGRRNDGFVVVFDLTKLFATEGELLISVPLEAGGEAPCPATSLA
jgi:purine-binding chemotaxis protein CheW